MARLHQSGYVHRDLYTSHIYMDSADGEMQLYLIDVARMFRPRCRVLRWRVKDLAQLKYSMPPAWVQGHWDAFLQDYLRRLGVTGGHRYAGRIERKVAMMRRRLCEFPAAPGGK